MSASVSPEARLGEGCTVGPGTVIEAGAVVGQRCQIGAGCYLAEGSVLGDDCRLDAGVVLMAGVRAGNGCHFSAGVVLGSCGFGYVLENGEHVPIPQVAGVVLGDRVFIGPSSCIDRGTVSDTRVGNDVRIGAQVQIGHNCRIGDSSTLEDMVGLAGSSIVGTNCTMELMSGLAGHASLGDNSRLGMHGGSTRRSPANSNLWGFPARPKAEAMKVHAALLRLPRLVEELERRVGEPQDPLNA